MIRRFAAVSVMSSAAVLGYIGARRLGEWIDAPLRAFPESVEPPKTTADRSVISAPQVGDVISREVEAPA